MAQQRLSCPPAVPRISVSPCPHRDGARHNDGIGLSPQPLPHDRAQESASFGGNVRRRSTVSPKGPPTFLCTEPRHCTLPPIRIGRVEACVTVPSIIGASCGPASSSKCHVTLRDPAPMQVVSRASPRYEPSTKTCVDTRRLHRNSGKAAHVI